MITRFRLPALTAARLEERGVAVVQVLRRAGLPQGLFQQDRILLTTDQLFAFWEAVGDTSRNPLIGLSLGSEDRIERFDVVSLAALSAPTLAEAMDRVARYKQIACPEEIQITRGEHESSVCFRWLLAKGQVPHVLVDLCFAWIATLAKRGTNGAIAPVRIEFSGERGDAAAYAAHFGCAVVFDAPADVVVFRSSDFTHRFGTHNADLLAMLVPQLDAELADRQHDRDVRDEVRAVLRRLLASGRPELGDVARALASSARTLQRRLAGLGVTYQQVVEDARRDLACRYLQHSSLELAEISYLLGYEDANSFFRAFSRWMGMPPGRWRDAQRAGLAADSVKAEPQAALVS
jgi:AraC-like DNA-binding protein